MTVKQLFAFSVIVFLSSCKPSNPETILGIKLGLPEKSQITDAILVGKIKTDGDRKYVDYGLFRGYLWTSTVTNSNDVEILDFLSLDFVNPNFRHPNLPILPANPTYNEWLTESDMQNLIETYEGKYGEPKYENNLGNDIRTWQKGDLEIKLITRKHVEFLGKVYCTASASYSYKEEIDKKLREEEKKNNKSI